MASSYEPDEAKKSRWLKKAQPALERRCAANDAEHCYYLGIAHEHGNGASLDPVKSFIAYRKSCDLTFKMGCTNLAGNYSLERNQEVIRPSGIEVYTSAFRYAGDDYAITGPGSIHSGETQTVNDRSHVEHGAIADVIDNTKPGEARAT